MGMFRNLRLHRLLEFKILFRVYLLDYEGENLIQENDIYMEERYLQKEKLFCRCS